MEKLPLSSSPRGATRKICPSHPGENHNRPPPSGHSLLASSAGWMLPPGGRHAHGAACFKLSGTAASDENEMQITVR